MEPCAAQPPRDGVGRGPRRLRPRRRRAHGGRGARAASRAGRATCRRIPRRFAGAAGLRRPPGAMINRGTFARLAAIGSACEQFRTRARPQARRRRWSRSAPASTRWWALHALGRQPRLRVEVDQEVVRRKALAIGRDAALHGALPEGAAARRSSAAPSRRPPATSCAQLTCATCRRSRRRSPTPAGGPPSRRWCSPSACSYLPPEAAAAVVALRRRAGRWRARRVRADCPDDPFGRTMVDNLRRRNCAPSASPRARAARRRRRAPAPPATRARRRSRSSSYEAAVSADERRRVERLELFDELEEWRLLLSHYAVALAVRDDAVASTRRSARSRFARRSRPVPPPPAAPRIPTC